jgi:hypothetical protein
MPSGQLPGDPRPASGLSRFRVERMTEAAHGSSFPGSHKKGRRYVRSIRMEISQPGVHARR